MSGRPSTPSWASLEGLPNPLGATWIAEEEAWNFAVHSEHAEHVTLLLYTGEEAATPVLTQRLDHLRNKSGPVWHCRIPTAAMQGARFYAYQVEGPRSPRHPFDAAKILFDPYARALHFPPGFDRQAAIGPGANAGLAPSASASVRPTLALPEPFLAGRRPLVRRRAAGGPVVWFAHSRLPPERRLARRRRPLRDGQHAPGALRVRRAGGAPRATGNAWWIPRTRARTISGSRTGGCR